MSAIVQDFGLRLPQLLGVFAAYVLGCFNTGYYIVRWKTGQDLRTIGSGTAGAKNVGRILGPWGFGATLLGDILKGGLAVQAGRLADWSAVACVLLLLAVTAGHNWPAQLGFRGGKGVATSFGGLMLFNPILAGAMLGVCGVLLAVTRRFTFCAAVSYALSPALAMLCGIDRTVALLLIPLAGLVVLPHLPNLRKELTPKSDSVQR